MPGFVRRHAGVFSVLLVFLASACGSQSPGSSVLETERVALQSTITYFENLGPTMTAQYAVQANQIATLQADLDRFREQNRTLTLRLNQLSQLTGQTPIAPGVPTTDPVAQATAAAAVRPGATAVGSTGVLPTPANPGGFGTFPTATPFVASQPVVPAGTPIPTPGPVKASSGLTLEKITTAKAKDDNGCASSPTNIFSLADKEIYVAFTARSFRAGTKFAAKWAGNAFERQDEWTSQNSGTALCIYFFIEPATLGLKPGTFTVTISATDATGTLEASPYQFTVAQ